MILPKQGLEMTYLCSQCCVKVQLPRNNINTWDFVLVFSQLRGGSPTEDHILCWNPFCSKQARLRPSNCGISRMPSNTLPIHLLLQYQRMLTSSYLESGEVDQCEYRRASWFLLPASKTNSCQGIRWSTSVNYLLPSKLTADCYPCLVLSVLWSRGKGENSSVYDWKWLIQWLVPATFKTRYQEDLPCRGM